MLYYYNGPRCDFVFVSFCFVGVGQDGDCLFLCFVCKLYDVVSLVGHLFTRALKISKLSFICSINFNGRIRVCGEFYECPCHWSVVGVL